MGGGLARGLFVLATASAPANPHPDPEISCNEVGVVCKTGRGAR